MGRKRLPPGVWVFFNKPRSVRHGLVGKVLPVLGPKIDWHGYRLVEFPLMREEPWRCALEHLRAATEEEIAITIARAALGHNFWASTKQVYL